MLNQILGPVLSRLPENNRLELIWKLAQVDFKKRYYDSYLGLVWALLNPLFRVAIYYFVFTYFFNNGIPNFALYLFSGLIFWSFFAEGTTKGLNILKQKRYLLENIQFNKLDLFTSATLSVSLGFFFNIAAFVLISAITGVYPTANFFWSPILILNLFLLVLAVSILLATFNIYFKDIVHVWDMVLLLGFWVTPILYDADVLKGKLALLLYLNPMSGIVVNGHYIFLNEKPIDYTLLIYNLAYSIILLIFAVYFFKRHSYKAAEKL